MSTHVNESKTQNETMLTKRAPKYSKRCRAEELSQHILDEYQLDNLSAPLELKNDPEAPVVMTPLLPFDSNTGTMLLTPLSSTKGGGFIEIDVDAFDKLKPNVQHIGHESLLFTEMVFSSSKNNHVFETSRHRGGARGIVFHYKQFGEGMHCGITPGDLEL